MSDNAFEYVLLAECETELEAHLVRDQLALARIDCRIEGAPLHGALGEIPFLETCVKIKVRQLKKSQAEQILLNYRQSKEHSDSLPSWLCPKCGQANAGNFEICWSCQSEKHETK